MITTQSVGWIGPPPAPPCDCVPLHTLTAPAPGAAIASGVLAMVLAVALCAIGLAAASGWAHPPRRVLGGLISTILGASLVSTALLLIAAVDGSVVHAWWFPVLVGSYIVTVVTVVAIPLLARLARSARAGGAAAEPVEAQDAETADRAAS